MACHNLTTSYQYLSLRIHIGFVKVAPVRISADVMKYHHLIDVGFVFARSALDPCHQLADETTSLGRAHQTSKWLHARHSYCLTYTTLDGMTIARDMVSGTKSAFSPRVVSMMLNMMPSRIELRI